MRFVRCLRGGRNRGTAPCPTLLTVLTLSAVVGCQGLQREAVPTAPEGLPTTVAAAAPSSTRAAEVPLATSTVLATANQTCASSVEILFETVVKGFKLATYPGAPILYVATREEETRSFVDLLSPTDARSIDPAYLHDNFIIAVFQGAKATSGYAIEVQDVAYVPPQEVKISAKLTVPGLSDPVLDAFTSPYHVIGVERAETLREQEILFVLVDMGGQELARTSHTIS